LLILGQEIQGTNSRLIFLASNSSQTLFDVSKHFSSAKSELIDHNGYKGQLESGDRVGIPERKKMKLLLHLLRLC